MGYPLTSQICGAVNGGCYQWFQGGLVFSSAATAPQSVTRPYHQAWVAQGNENGWLGYPLTSQICGAVNGGCYQWYQGGLIFSSAATAPQAMSRPIHQAWVSQGNENGWMGYPTSATTPDGQGGTRQTFQAGTITISSTGAVTITR
jgi:uncharacterized protein with LGFP repeats